MTSAYLAVAICLACAEGERIWTFEKDKPGKEPDGFYFTDTGRAPDGKWRVVEDGRRDEDDEDDRADKVLAQLDRSRDSSRYALAIVEDFALEDLKLSVRLKAVDGEHDQAGGIVWRYKNSENYLVVRLDVTERNVRLYRFVRGHRIQFGVERDLNLRRGQWYTLRVEHRGREIKVYLDDEVLFIEHDRHFTNAGKIGLWTKSDSVVYFDDLTVRNLDDPDDDD